MSDSIQQAYDVTDFEMVEVGNGYEVPQSKPAHFEFSDPGVISDAVTAQNAIDAGDYTLIAPVVDNGEDDAFYFSSKVLASETNEFFHVKMNADGVRLYPKDAEFSFETLSQIVSHLETELGTDLLFVPDTDESPSSEDSK